MISKAFPRSTRTALDVSGPCVEAFGCIEEKAHLPCGKTVNSKKLLRNRFRDRWHEPRYWGGVSNFPPFAWNRSFATRKTAAVFSSRV